MSETLKLYKVRVDFASDATYWIAAENRTDAIKAAEETAEYFDGRVGWFIVDSDAKETTELPDDDVWDVDGQPVTWPPETPEEPDDGWGPKKVAIHPDQETLPV